VLACLSPGSGNSKLLCKASAAARARDAEFYAVMVGLGTRFGRREICSLIDDAVLASQLGAKILRLDEDDEVDGLLQLADKFRIGRIFVRRHRPALWSWLFGHTLYSGLLRRAERVRIDVVGFERGN
jgi:K+-sensing histidine kinase KdpD